MDAVSTEDFIASLSERFPTDADDLREALEVFSKHRINSLERLTRLTDSQWQRLGLPLGTEALLRDEVQGAAPVNVIDDDQSYRQHSQHRVADQQQFEDVAKQRNSAEACDSSLPLDEHGEIPLEPFEEEGLYRRGRKNGNMRVRERERNSNSSMPSSRPEKSKLLESELAPPADLEQLWQQLLEETLTPDRRGALQEAWQKIPGAHDKYMMFLEYASYLRKPELSEEDKIERRKQLEPLMREFGIGESMCEESPVPWMLVSGLTFSLLVFILGLVYYAFNHTEIVHDADAL